MIQLTFLFFRVTVCKELKNSNLKPIFVLFKLLGGVIPLSSVSALCSVKEYADIIQFF